MARPSEVCMPPVDFPQSTWQMFEDGAHKNLDAPVLTACHQAANHYVNLLPSSRRNRPHNCLKWTYGELRHASLVVAKAMSDAGVRRGMTMMVPLANGIETHIVRVVSFILQLTLVALDRDLVDAGRKDELAFFIKTLSPDIIVVPDDAAGRAVDEAAKTIGSSLHLRFLTQEYLPGPDSISWATLDSSSYDEQSLEDLAAAQQADLDQEGQRVALILFTSGTSTGRPKGCPQTVLNVVSAAYNQMWIEDIRPCYAVQSPHSRAIYNCMGFMAMASGHHIILSHTHFVPEKMYAAVERFDIELLLCVPAQIKIMEGLKHLDWSKLTSVGRVVLGGDIITTDLIEKAGKLFPQATITTVWGMSEGTGTIGLRGTDITPPLRTYHSIATVGKAARAAEVRICDEEDHVLPRGEEGELVVHAPTMIDHYVDNVQPELFYTDEHGTWIKTGDKAMMDDDDYVYMIGRTKDIIKQSGINLSPGVLEATLNKHDGNNVAIVGVPDPIKGEVPVAVNPGELSHRRKSSIKETVVESLGRDYALKEVYGLADLGMKDFPFSLQGKLQKFKLKEAVLRFERKKLMGEMFYPWFL